MSKVQFYIPESVQLPTELRAKKDHLSIKYNRVLGDFAYEFDVYNLKTEEEGLEVVKEMAQIFCDQSYDHGSEWRVERIDTIICDIGGFIQHANYIVKFRIKDTW